MGPVTLTSPASVYVSKIGHTPGGLTAAPLGGYRVLHANRPYQPQWSNPSPFSNTAYAIRVLDRRRKRHPRLYPGHERLHRVHTCYCQYCSAAPARLPLRVDVHQEAQSPPTHSCCGLLDLCGLTTFRRRS